MSTNISIISLCVALLSTALGQLLFKIYFKKKKNKYFVGAMTSFLCIPLFSYLALINLTISAVYMSTALTHVLVLIGSYTFLEEKLSTYQYMSMTLIISGITVFNL
tara:strand:- start:62 stop:379 length:318 start_codon:yes stop_codon:yes gene_type:complete